jgi:hypothetical protein
VTASIVVVIRAFAGSGVVFGGGNDLICADLGADRVIAGSGGTP